MFQRLLPRHIDNAYHGYKAALWLFAVIVLMKSAVGLNSIFNGRSVALSADGIPLDTYTPAGAQAVVSAFAAWGLAQFVICLICLLALVRYRAMVPLMFTLLLLEHLCRRLLFWVMPIARTATPPGFYVNLLLTALLVVGLALSLRGRGGRQAKE
jgi:hypothetical protein